MSALAVKQQMILDRIARLEDRMFRLREKLAEAEPENAAKLQAAMERAGALDVKTRMEALAEALRGSRALDAAADEQARLLSDLESVLDVLLDRNPDDASRRAERKRLAEIKQELDHIVRAQQEMRQQAANAVRAERLARQVDAARKELQTLLERQGALHDRTLQADAEDAGAAGRQAVEQRQLAEQAQRLARELKRLAGEAEGLEMGDADAEPGDEADTTDGGPLDDAAEQTQGGAADMQAASAQRATERVAAAQKQDEAAEKLRAAIHRLEEAREQLEAKSKTPQGGAAQQALAQRTHKLAQRMQPGSAGEPTPESQEGGPSDAPPSADPNAPTPGQENVDRAQQHMDEARGKLEEQNPADAVPAQDAALDELERAQRALEDTLKQLRAEEKEETLRNIESRLEELRSGQTAVNEETQPLSALGAENFTRTDALKCAELAARQEELAAVADNCVRLLTEDGTTIVFPQVMRQVTEDMQEIGRRLQAQDVGRLTTTLQADVRATLTELLEALKRLREDTEKQSQSAGAAGGGAGGAPTLVPTSAELKLLRTVQARINQQTAAAAEMPAAAGDATANDAATDAEAVLNRAAGMQAELVEMTRAMQARAEKGE